MFLKAVTFFFWGGGEGGGGEGGTALRSNSSFADDKAPGDLIPQM